MSGIPGLLATARHDRCPGGMISSPRVCVTVCVGVCKFVCLVLCVRERAMIHASIAHWVVFHITVCVCVPNRPYPAGGCVHEPAHPDLRGCGELLFGPGSSQHLFQDQRTARSGHVREFQHRRALLPCRQLLCGGQVSLYLFLLRVVSDEQTPLKFLDDEWATQKIRWGRQAQAKRNARHIVYTAHLH